MKNIATASICYDGINYISLTTVFKWVKAILSDDFSDDSELVEKVKEMQWTAFMGYISRRNVKRFIQVITSSGYEVRGHLRGEGNALMLYSEIDNLRQIIAAGIQRKNRGLLAEILFVVNEIRNYATVITKDYAYTRIGISSVQKTRVTKDFKLTDEVSEITVNFSLSGEAIAKILEITSMGSHCKFDVIVDSIRRSLKLFGGKFSIISPSGLTEILVSTIVLEAKVYGAAKHQFKNVKAGMEVFREIIEFLGVSCDQLSAEFTSESFSELVDQFNVSETLLSAAKDKFFNAALPAFTVTEGVIDFLEAFLTCYVPSGKIDEHLHAEVVTAITDDGKTVRDVPSNPREHAESIASKVKMDTPKSEFFRIIWDDEKRVIRLAFCMQLRSY